MRLTHLLDTDRISREHLLDLIDYMLNENPHYQVSIRPYSLMISDDYAESFCIVHLEEE